MSFPVSGKKPRSIWVWIAIIVGGIGVLACIAACIVFALSSGADDASPTSTPAPTATPTPLFLPGALLYEEDFTIPDEQWLIEAGQDAEFSVDGGVYTILVNRANWMAWEGTGGDYADFVLELDAVLTDGDEYNSYGCLFRYEGKNSHYELDINGAGSYAIGKDINDEWTQIVDWTESPAILPAGEVNRIRLVGSGITFILYINDQFVDSFVDASLASGDIAPVVTAYDDPPARAEFDNIRIWDVETR